MFPVRFEDGSSPVEFTNIVTGGSKLQPEWDRKDAEATSM